VLDLHHSGEQRIQMSYGDFLAWTDGVHAEWEDGDVIVLVPSQGWPIPFNGATGLLVAGRVGVWRHVSEPVENVAGAFSRGGAGFARCTFHIDDTHGCSWLQ
jgi:hypothetical protein